MSWSTIGRALALIPELVAGLLLALIVILVFVQVIARYYLHFPLAWTEEGARFLFTWVSFLGAAVALRGGEHFSATVLVDRLPERPRNVLHVATRLLTAGFLIFLVDHGFRASALAFRQTSPVLDLPIGWLYLPLPVAAGLMLAHLAARTVHELAGKTATAEGSDGPTAHPGQPHDVGPMSPGG